jgi:hypothetical protein
VVGAEPHCAKRKIRKSRKLYIPPRRSIEKEERQKKGMKRKTMAISLAVVWTAVIIAAGIMPVSAQTENEFADEFFKLKKEGGKNSIRRG